MINYTWLISNLELKKQESLLKNVVITINWTLTASEGEYISREFGATKLPAADPNSFIDFHNLTNNTLVNWIVENENVDSLKQKLAHKIAEMQSEPTVSVNFTGAGQTPVQATLEQPKNYAKQRLQASYNSELMQGVTSTALGTQHTYRILPAEVTNIQLAAQFGGLLYCCKDSVWSYQEHTQEQAAAILYQIWQHIQQAQQKLQVLRDSIDAAASEEEINSVVW